MPQADEGMLPEFTASMKVALLERQIRKLLLKVVEQRQEIERLKAEKGNAQCSTTTNR